MRRALKLLGGAAAAGAALSIAYTKGYAAALQLSPNEYVALREELGIDDSTDDSAEGSAGNGADTGAGAGTGTSASADDDLTNLDGDPMAGMFGPPVAPHELESLDEAEELESVDLDALGELDEAEKLDMLGMLGMAGLAPELAEDDDVDLFK